VTADSELDWMTLISVVTIVQRYSAEISSLGKTKEPVTLLLAALKFAADKHSRQRRKDLEATPYSNHLIEVAEVLSRIGRNNRLTHAPGCDFARHH
jgi:(p)ppGpp synthase/HD superfamily hydrolase